MVSSCHLEVDLRPMYQSCLWEYFCREYFCPPFWQQFVKIFGYKNFATYGIVQIYVIYVFIVQSK